MMKQFIAFLLTLISFSVFAKCANVNYRITGVVTDLYGSTVKDALVMFRWSESTGDEPLIAGNRTDSQGHYIVDLSYYPWSGMDNGGDICDGILTEVDFKIELNNCITEVKTLLLDGESTIANLSFNGTCVPHAP